MNAMSRTLLVGASSAGLVLGSALAAGASERDDDRHGDHDRRWSKGGLTVCQYVKEDDRRDYGQKDNDRKDGKKGGYDDSNSKMKSSYRYDNDRHRNEYVGKYVVRDSRGKWHRITLRGKSDCERIRVNTGWARVFVIDRPDDTRLKSASNRWVKVKKYDSAHARFFYEEKDHHSHYAKR
jgi:hypothetical protein